MFQVLKLVFKVLKLVFPAWKHRIISYKKLFLAKSTKKIMQFIASVLSRDTCRNVKSWQIFGWNAHGIKNNSYLYGG